MARLQPIPVIQAQVLPTAGMRKETLDRRRFSNCPRAFPNISIPKFQTPFSLRLPFVLAWYDFSMVWASLKGQITSEVQCSSSCEWVCTLSSRSHQKISATSTLKKWSKTSNFGSDRQGAHHNSSHYKCSTMTMSA